MLTVVAVVLLTLVGCSEKPPIRVGVLHSLSGNMAISESSVADATIMAIDELNSGGGLLGRRIEAVKVDGKSDGEVFAAEAERLITEQKVDVIFGCWTSASRKTVLPVLEKHQHLLFYPVQYEGLEQSPYVVYTGAAPNQQLIPAVKWCSDHLGKRFFLVGSDYVYPRTANAIATAQITALGGEVVGEHYLLLGSQEVKSVIDEVLATHPDVMLNTINGDTNVAFFKALRTAGITPAEIPTMSFSLAENELRGFDSKMVAGDYAAWNYFQSLDNQRNRDFVARFKARYGPDRVTDDPIEAAYFGVYLWAEAVREAGSSQVHRVRQAVGGQSYPAPEGTVYIDPTTQHTWKSVRIGRIVEGGQFAIEWSSDKPVRPVPYPFYRTRSDWDSYLSSMYQDWGGRWSNPGK
ncbi:MAG: urea ABC transporter substrate-binding protein [Vulcanimicrobiota bacterium]